jgi:hypothetical protein
MGEVAIPAETEAMARHIDRGAKPVAVKELGEPEALIRVEDLAGEGKPAFVELIAQPVPIKRVHALADGGRWRCGGGHGSGTTRSRGM